MRYKLGMETQHTVDWVLDQYSAECLHRLAPRTRKDYVAHIKILRQHFGPRVAAELVPRDFRDFMDVKRGRIHRNRSIAVLSAAFTYAVRRLYVLDRNVLRDVARHESSPRTRYVTDAEYESFKAFVSLRIKLAMDLALLTGQRQGDILSLRWDQIQDMAIVVRQGKTGKRLAIAITPAVEAVLDKCWQLANRGEYVIGNKAGAMYTSEGFRAGWQRFMRRWVKLGNTRFTFHDLRAKSASDSATIDDAYQRLGHTSIAMTRRAYDRGIRKVQPLR